MLPLLFLLAFNVSASDYGKYDITRLRQPVKVYRITDLSPHVRFIDLSNVKSDDSHLNLPAFVGSIFEINQLKRLPETGSIVIQWHESILEDGLGIVTVYIPNKEKTAIIRPDRWTKRFQDFMPKFRTLFGSLKPENILDYFDRRNNGE